MGDRHPAEGQAPPIPDWLIVVAKSALRVIERRDPGMLREVRDDVRTELAQAAVVTLRGPALDPHILAMHQAADLWLATLGSSCEAPKKKSKRDRR